MDGYKAGCAIILIARGTTMPDVLVRDLSEVDLKRMKERARRSGRSLQAELKAIIHQAAREPKHLSDLETANRIKAMLDPKKQSDSAKMLREDRAR